MTAIGRLPSLRGPHGVSKHSVSRMGSRRGAAGLIRRGFPAVARWEFGMALWEPVDGARVGVEEDCPSCGNLITARM